MPRSVPRRAHLRKVVVVNDGGTDLTTEVASTAEAGLRVQSLVLPARRGLPAARNAGIDVARGEFLAFLDDDDLFQPGHLHAAMQDWDFWLRLSRDHGYRFVYVAEPTVIYHRIAGQASMRGSTVSDAAALAALAGI